MQTARVEQGKLQPTELIFSFWDASEFSNKICTLTTVTEASAKRMRTGAKRGYLERPHQSQKDEGFAGAAARAHRNSLPLPGFLTSPPQVAAVEARSYAGEGTSTAFATHSCGVSRTWWPRTAPVPHIKPHLTPSFGLMAQREHM